MCIVEGRIDGKGEDEGGKVKEEGWSRKKGKKGGNKKKAKAIYIYN